MRKTLKLTGSIHTDKVVVHNFQSPSDWSLTRVKRELAMMPEFRGVKYEVRTAGFGGFDLFGSQDTKHWNVVITIQDGEHDGK